MIVIKGGRLINPADQTDGIYDIVIEDDRIKEIGTDILADTTATVIDAAGKIVAPGLVDVHVHFRDPGQTHKETIETGAKAAAAGGFTTVVCMANTSPVVDNEETLLQILKKAEKTEIHVLQTAAVTKDFKGKELTDMKRLHELGAVGFTDDGFPLTDGKLVMEAMKRVKELGVPISFHEEAPEYIQSSGVNQGRVSKLLGIGGAPAVAENVLVARDCMLALETGALVSIQHVSSAAAVEQVRLAKRLGAKVYTEATPQHFSCTEDLVLEKGTLAKLNPPLRTEADRQAVIAGLKDGTIEMIVTDHAPHTSEEKAASITEAPSGMIGLETALALGITNLVQPGHLTMMELLEKMTVNPAQLYQLECGSVRPGASADLVIFDDAESWTVETFHSKSSNSPFIGDQLCGKVKYTICSGKIVYQDEK